MSLTRSFVAIAGNIGAGKSTLTGMLAQTFGWQPFYEANAENPYLADFYREMGLWSFHSQMFFMGKRLEAHRLLVDFPGSVVQDRTVYEDAEIFARNLYEQGTMSARDWATYRSLYTAMCSFLPAPHLVIYLRASTDTLMTHIRQRGRDYEQQIAPNYVERLNRLYEEWISDWQLSQVMTIEMDQYDFQHVPEHYDAIVNQVRAQLVTI
jgi:deoxyadenosine/deoxycytidine kinase